MNLRLSLAAPTPLVLVCATGGRRMALQVLLAEDEALVAMALADFVEMQGHRVTVASDGLDALEAARDLGGLDLLITDLQMPNLGGEGLIRALWAERPGLPVIV